jgi:hypothetical protein
MRTGLQNARIQGCQAASCRHSASVEVAIVTEMIVEA